MPQTRHWVMQNLEVLIGNSSLNLLNKQRHPLFKVGSREKDFLLVLHVYFEWSIQKITSWSKICSFSQTNVTSQKSSLVESFFQNYQKSSSGINWFMFNRNCSVFQGIWALLRMESSLQLHFLFRIITNNFIRILLLTKPPFQAAD